MNTNYKISSKKRYIKRTKERQNKQKNLLLPNFDVFKFNNDFKIFKYKKSDELNKYKEIYPKHLWCRCTSCFVNHRYNKNMFYDNIDDDINYSYRYICDFCSFDLDYYNNDYKYILQFNDVYNITIQNNIINKFKKVINNNIKYKLNKIISDKLNNINFINKISNKINDRIIISNPSYKEKSIIFYDKESITEFLLNNIINYKLKTYYGIIFKSISLKSDISIYRKNKIKNYVKFQYLLCIISIMRQKFNFQDYGFCNYFISFL